MKKIIRNDSGKVSKHSGLNIFSNFLLIIMIIIFFLVLYVSYTLNENYKTLRKTLSRFLITQETSKTIKSSSIELTELARLFIINHDERFALAYLEEIDSTKSQKKALENLKDIFPDKSSIIERINIAIGQAESLTTMELYDIRLCYEIIGKKENEIPEIIRNIELKSSDKNLTHEEMHKLAINNIFGNGYLIYRIRVIENCNTTVDTISKEIKQELDGNSDELSKNLDRLRILILVLITINSVSTISLREFKSVAKSYTRLYEIGEKQKKTLLKNAEYDALTGILNRRAYEEICKASEEEGNSIALLLLDVDNFKSINDTYGHQGGDNALKIVSKILNETFRNRDYIARIGGDEFAVILTDFKITGLPIVKEKIIKINSKLEKLKELKNISISVGMSHSSTGYSEKLYREADKALYYVKENGKNGCRIYDSSLD